jgi:hypothetical protein
MKDAINLYNVDMVVGNLLNNKKWVKIQLNPRYVEEGEVSCRQFTDDIEKNIIEETLRCFNNKFR